MQRHFKPGRVILSILVFFLMLVSFSDVRGNLWPNFHTSVFYFQFVPSVIKFITPGAILSVGFIIVVALTIVGGRVYCSTLCPLGVLQDILIYLRKKALPKKRIRQKDTLIILRYSILLLTVLSLFLSGILFLNVLDPYAVFGRIGAHIFQPALIALNNLTVRFLPDIGLSMLKHNPAHWASLSFALGMLLLVILLTFTKGRLYCNSVCPVGTFLGLLSKVSLFKIRLDDLSCTRCGKCKMACKANCIDIKTMSLDETRCINCYNCISVCEDKAVYYRPSIIKKQSNRHRYSENGRRFFLSALTLYVVSKSTKLYSQENKSEKDSHSKCYFRKGPISPPGSQSINHFKNRCVACHLCISVCPTKVLQPSFLEYGFTGINLPEMNYAVNYCNFDCVLCSKVCPTGAIIKQEKEDKQVIQIGEVVLRKDLCIVQSEGTACGSCSEHCPTQAVRMEPYENGLPGPVIEPVICIGCGACQYACPVEDPHPAIFVFPNNSHLIADKPDSEKVEFVDDEEFPF